MLVTRTKRYDAAIRALKAGSDGFREELRDASSESLQESHGGVAAPRAELFIRSVRRIEETGQKKSFED